MTAPQSNDAPENAILTQDQHNENMLANLSHVGLSKQLHKIIEEDEKHLQFLTRKIAVVKESLAKLGA